MALPSGITPKTVTVGIASFFDGSLAEGTATITAPVNVVHTPTNRPIFSSQMSHRFVDGETSFNLCPTDAPGLNRVDFAYKLSVIVSGALVQPEPIYFTLPTAGPDTIDLDALVTVPSSAGTPISVDVLTTEDLPGHMADVAADGDSEFAVAQRAAFVHLNDEGQLVIEVDGVETVVGGGGGGGGMTLEQIQDAVAAMVLAGTNVTKVYDDTAGTLTLSATSGGGTDQEVVRDTIAAALVAGSGITITPNDVGDTITIGVTGFATVATTGAYSDLSGKPTIPAAYTDAQAITANAPAVAPVAYTGTYRGAWAGNIAYAVGDVVTAEGGLFRATTAATSNNAGFRYDREKWETVTLPALGAGTAVPVRQQTGTSFAAGVFQRRPKQFAYRGEKLLAAIQTTSQVTITQGNGTVAAGTAVGGSLVFTSPSNTTEGLYRLPPLASPVNLTNGSIRALLSVSAVTGNYAWVEVTSAAGGTDYTNCLRFTLISGSLDNNRTGQYHWVGTAETEPAIGTGADLSAVTGIRVGLYRGTAQFTAEIAKIVFQPNLSSIAKCILWLDDGNFASHKTAIATAAKYGLPVTLAPIAANLVNGSAGLTVDQARYVQDQLRGQVAVHAFGEVDHNRVQTGATLFEQLVDYQHFGQAAGLHGVEDIAYWSTGFTGPESAALELTVRKLFRSGRGGRSRAVECLPPVDHVNTRAMMTGGADTSVGTWQPYAQRAINTKGLAQFVWHDMTAGVLTEFETFCAWLNTNRASIEVTTPAGAFDPLCV